MHPVIRNILAVLAGLIIGGIINAGLIIISGSIIPLPDGVDPMNVDSLKENMHLFEVRHFIMPFLAHALGTLVGAFIAAKIAGTKKMVMAMIIGVLFLIGGIMNVIDLPAPMWFNVTDLVLAYIPMAWIGGKMGSKSAQA